MEKIRDCTWEQFEEIIRKAIDSDFAWKIRPGDTEANRQAVMESVERMLREHNGRFPEEGDMFIKPEKRKSAPPDGETS
jgi:hypothetical protein